MNLYSFTNFNAKNLMKYFVIFLKKKNIFLEINFDFFLSVF